MAQGYGDRLARGSTRANFANAGKNVSQKQWNDIFGEDSGPAQKIKSTEKKTRKTRKSA